MLSMDRVGVITCAAIVILLLLLSWMATGCVLIVNYAPAATRAALYQHEQSATNMVINQEVPITAQLADKLSGVLGASIEGNNIKGIEANSTVNAPVSVKK